MRFLFLLITLPLLQAANTPLAVTLLSSKPSPQPVGVPLSIWPKVDTSEKGMLVYRYSASVDGGPFHVIRDFSQQADLVWSPALHEQQATIRVAVRNNGTKTTAGADLPFRIISRVKGTTPVVVPTVNPLVALFSAPPCEQGTQFRVALRHEGSETITRTPLQPCRSGISNNTYVAGMRSDAEYRLRAELVKGNKTQTGDWLPFHTGLLDGDFPPVSVAVPRSDRSPVAEPVVLRSVAAVAAGKRAFATDQDGEVIWYGRTGMLTRIVPGGHFLQIGEGLNSANTMQARQVLQEFDLVGNVIRETNISRIAEQMESKGIHSDCRKGSKECIPSFHHEAIRAPNGHTFALAGLERIMPAGTQGSKEPVDILGDVVLELDEDFQLVNFWNSFDHLDVTRAALDKGKCAEGPGRGGCTAIFLAPEAQAWLHSNALNYIPETGDFLVSLRAQCWVIRVDWKNGKGTGNVLWRLGEGGDFKVDSTDPSPWFSYQHDIGFDPPGSNTLTLFDNGNARQEKNPASHSRGQAWQLDEQNRTAKLVENADVGVYSFAVGSAQKLSNGGYNFEAGFTNQTSNTSHAIETSADGKIVYAQKTSGLIEYRTFRLPDLYSAPRK